MATGETTFNVGDEMVNRLNRAFGSSIGSRAWRIVLLMRLLCVTI